MRAAFATTDLATVNAHFGWTPNLVIYEVSPEGSELVARHAFEHATADGTHDKLPPRLDALAGCTVLFSAAIGAGAAAKVAALGVHAARPQETDRIPELLEKLSRLLAGTPPPWLRKALQRKEEET